MRNELKLGILGATGMVGQQYIKLLADHPWFKVSRIVGKKSAGMSFKEAAEWVGEYDPPASIMDMKVDGANPESEGADLFVSCLPTDGAKELEPLYARLYPTFSDASAYRMEDDVPLIIPEVNAEQGRLVERQKKSRNWKGFLVTGPNCTSIGLNMTLKPLDDEFKIRKVIVSTMQAVSGAGYPGVPSLSIIDNVIPYIKDEEDKVAIESNKILGKFVNGRVEPAGLAVSAMCHRVATIDGHMESVYIETEKPVSVKDASQALRDFTGLPQSLKLPTAPERPIIVREEPDRPQVRKDKNAGTVPGMSTVVGRIRPGLDNHSLKYTLLSHNTIRGAAGNTILTAELFYKQGWMNL
ncbi:MAG: aspartate-semialdehyde dehydrogenase [Nitrososphaerota archaeon]|jgi:aspartate-semialdehyde dehydrogenase|nr:aspartate-semialdehyde dehydrogenase [Nitrososphaerota archaeon]MDG7037769.1 aspartate-semialdehyde dehydrogenase [Nitrososphaerota archaeon]